MVINDIFDYDSNYNTLLCYGIDLSAIFKIEFYNKCKDAENQKFPVGSHYFEGRRKGLDIFVGTCYNVIKGKPPIPIATAETINTVTSLRYYMLNPDGTFQYEGAPILPEPTLYELKIKKIKR